MRAEDTAFEFRGLNHLALVCSDMARTVEFYSDVLGMPLIKTIDLPGGGQHFFFDIGNGDSLAFFWFPDAPPAAPGIASAGSLPGGGSLTSAVGSMNHVAFDVPVDQIDSYVARLRTKGVKCSGVVNHDDSEMGVAEEMHDGVFVRSVYFQDPDGILLEFAAWIHRPTPLPSRFTRAGEPERFSNERETQAQEGVAVSS
jgi:catechol 2,3-dioxygenase-like lactoylglutathione lyase family enzyme